MAKIKSFSRSRSSKSSLLDSFYNLDLFNKTVVVFTILALITIPFLIFDRLTYKQQAAVNLPPSGETMPVGDIPGWHQIFTDDFTTDVPLGSFPSAVSTKWSAYPDGWKDTSKNGTYYSSKVVSISNGVLNQNVHTENGIHMVSAIMPKLPSGAKGQLYGRYVIRFRSDSVPGYKTAWLLWPDSETWPRDGEIDFPEGNLNKTISAFMHKQNATSGSDQDAYSTSVTYSAWHTAVIDWGPDKTNFILDGNTIGTSTSRIPNTSMHYVIQTETALDGTVPTDLASGNVQIDWVAVYAPVTGTVINTPTPTLIPTSTPIPPTPTPTLKPTATPTPKPTSTPTPTPVPPTPTTIIISSPTPIQAYPTPTPTQKKHCYKVFNWKFCF
jgi:beta-glucanase (GH16 family)